MMQCGDKDWPIGIAPGDQPANRNYTLTQPTSFKKPIGSASDPNLFCTNMAAESDSASYSLSHCALYLSAVF